MSSERDFANLQAFVDDELPPGERAAFEARLGADPVALAEVEELRLLRQVVQRSLEAEGERVPEARFEQLWDEVERTLDRDARLQQAADLNISVWSRLAAMMRPLWAPVGAVGVVAAAIALYVSSSDGEPAVGARENTPTTVASKGEPPAAGGDEMPTPTENKDPIIAKGESLPVDSAAEIQRIEFGGNAGRIDHIEGKQGITTVIWVSEDEETKDSERSL